MAFADIRVGRDLAHGGGPAKDQIVVLGHRAGDGLDQRLVEPRSGISTIARRHDQMQILALLDEASLDIDRNGRGVIVCFALPLYERCGRAKRGGFEFDAWAIPTDRDPLDEPMKRPSRAAAASWRRRRFTAGDRPPNSET